MTLYEMTGTVLYLYSLFENGDIDEQTVNDTIEGMCVEDKLEDYCKVIRQFEAETEMLKAEETRLAKKREKAEKAIARLEQALLEYMTASNTDKKKCGTFELKVTHSKAVAITDESKIGVAYLVEQPPRIDKAAIRKALMAGESVPGAELKINDSLKVK